MLRRQTTICREGLYFLAIIALVSGGAVIKEVNLLLILAGMLLGPFLLNWRAVKANLRGLKVDRSLPLRISAGDVLSVDLNLTNTRKKLGSWAVVVEEQIQREARQWTQQSSPPAAAAAQCAVPVRPAPDESRKGVYRGRLVERGRYRLGPLRASTRFPFGLFSRTITLGESETLIVLPRLGRLTQGWAARRREALAGTDRRRQQPGNEGDFYGVARVAQRRRPTPDPLAKLRAGGQAGRPPVRAAAQP